MNYSVYISDGFEKEINKLSKEYSRRINNLFIQLRENPYAGDILRIRSLREKRLEEKRIYYLVFDDLKSVLIISIGGKKGQKKLINFIIENIDNFKNELKEKINLGNFSNSTSF